MATPKIDLPEWVLALPETPPAEWSSALADPIGRVTWRLAASLNANDYNPNVVYSPEMKLLEFSILRSGWIQPVLITADGHIIDGFHRHTLAKTSKLLMGKYFGYCPVVAMDLTRAEAMALTVRINRAKGSHVALRMADLVKELIDDHGWSVEQVAEEIGATRQEVRLLHENDTFKARNLDKLPYANAWIPRETRKHDGQPGALKLSRKIRENPDEFLPPDAPLPPEAYHIPREGAVAAVDAPEEESSDE